VVKIDLLDECATPQEKKFRRHRCRCMAQSTYYGAYLCSHNAVCYENNPLHKAWWEKVNKKGK
jgi:hypothetical protein